MFRYANEALYALIMPNLHTFQVHKSEDWIMPGSKLLFPFLDILETKQITEGILDISSYHSVNHKIVSTVIKNPFSPCF